MARVLRQRVGYPDEVASLDQLLDRGCDLVVEAAGHGALRRYAVEVLDSGSDLVVINAGGLADEAPERTIRAAGPGRVLISTGAIGGLDIVRATVRTGELKSVPIRSTTTPGALRNVDGGEELIASVADRGEPAVVFSGSARGMALRFPSLANVAATVVLTTLRLDHVEAEMIVDPSGRRKRHELTANAAISRLHVDIENVLSASNQATSAVTPYAVLRLLRDRVRPFAAGI